MEFKHVSVLLNECINGLNINPDGIYVDGTAGGAGHSKEIAKFLKNGKLIAFDRDPDAVKVASERLKEFNAQVVNENYSEIENVLKDLNICGVDGILLDLGVSSFQLDEGERGFSYHIDAPLDMRMSKSGLSAKNVVNDYSFNDLVKILFSYGEEKFAKSIARNIEKERGIKPIETTLELAEIIKNSVPFKVRKEKNPCKKTFQAIRIEVNDEFSHLKKGLESCFESLKIGGRFCVITFHSLEDRIVKQKFAEFCQGCICPPEFPQCVCGRKPRGKLVNKKPIIPTFEEIEVNNRSRSAKLRIIEKIS